MKKFAARNVESTISSMRTTEASPMVRLSMVPVLLDLVAQQFSAAHAIAEMPTLLHPLLDVRRVPDFEHDLLASRISTHDLQRRECPRGYRDLFLPLHDTTAKLFAGRPLERTLPGVMPFPGLSDRKRPRDRRRWNVSRLYAGGDPVHVIGSIVFAPVDLPPFRSTHHVVFAALDGVDSIDGPYEGAFTLGTFPAVFPLIARAPRRSLDDETGGDFPGGRRPDRRSLRGSWRPTCRQRRRPG